MNRFILKESLGWSFLRSYLSDVLAGPVILAYTNLLFVAVGKPEHGLRSFPGTLVFMFLVGMFWEFATPLFRKSAVTDWADILAYLIGGIAYWTMMQLMRREPTGPSCGLPPAPTHSQHTADASGAPVSAGELAPNTLRLQGQEEKGAFRGETADARADGADVRTVAGR